MTPRTKFSVVYLILFVCSTFIHMSAFAHRQNSYNSTSRDSRSNRSRGSSGSTRSQGQGQIHMRIDNNYKTGRLTKYSQPETTTSSSGQTITHQSYQSSRSGKPVANGTIDRSASGSYRSNHRESDGSMRQESFNSSTGTRIRESKDRFGQTQGYIRHTQH